MEKEITIEEVIDAILNKGIEKGLELNRLREKQIKQKAYDQGWIDSRF